MRHLFSIIILIIGLSAGLFVDRWQVDRERRDSELALKIEASLSATRLKDSVKMRLGAIQSLASLIRLHPHTTPEEFGQFAQFLMESNPPVRALQYADKNTRVTYVYPKKNNEITVTEPMVLIQDPKRGPYVKKAIDEKRITMQGPFELRQGGMGVVFRNPIFEGDQFLGLAIGVYDIPILLSEAFPYYGVNGTRRFIISVHDGYDHLIWGEEFSSEQVESVSVQVGDCIWQIKLGWQGNSLASNRMMRLFVSIVMMAMTMLLLFISNYMWQNKTRLEKTIMLRTTELQDANDSMTEEIRTRKETEAELEVQRYRLVKAQEIGCIGTWELDLVNNVLTWTKENHNIFGIPEEKGAVLTYETFLGCVHPDDRDYVNQEWMAGIAGKPYDIEHRLLVNGKVKWVREKAELIHDEKGNPIHAVGVTQDISKRREAELKREDLIGELETKNTELERFTYTVSHDLKSPLVSIKGFIGLLEKDITEHNIEQAKEDMNFIADAADKMYGLLEDLLELSRIGRMVKPSEKCSLADISHDVIEILAPALREKHIQISVSSSLPTVNGDKERITEVMQNLIENSIKYTGDQSSPIIEISVRTDSGGDQVVCVRDNGIGIDPKYQDKVFGLFNQLNPDKEGSGVGLAIVKRIIELHGGRIWVESEGEGKGAAFCFTLGTNV